jgi:hypothetical protein
MAFCPECGKSATAEAARCFHCGHELPALEKKAAGGRFKGTMIMAAPVVPKPAAPANANAASAVGAANAAPTVAAAPPIQAAPMRAEVPARPAKPNVRATMIGAGIAPAVLKAATTAQQVSVDSKQQAGVAQTQVLFNASAATAPTPIAPEPPQAADRQRAFDAQASDAHHYLPGDPMAPQAARADHAPQLAAARGPVPRLLDQDELRAYGESLAPAPIKDRKLLMLAVGGVVVLSVLLLAFGLMR